MLYGLIQLTWFEATTAALPFITVALLQLLNALLTDQTTRRVNSANELTTAVNLLAEDGTAATTTAANGKSTAANGAENGKLQKQKSEHSDDHEDEDTLSLENLFPCDQSEIYASKKISFIIDEVIQTEANYVNNLRKGIKNYGELHARSDAPESLKGAENRKRLLGNVEEILALHETQILPLMLRNQRDLKSLFDEFAAYFDKNEFYCYVIFMMNKKTSMQLRQEQRPWLQNVQNEISDKLGIDSFLVQPIQRLTRYPLLLQQFISEFYKSGISCKPVLASVCKLETRMRRLLEVVNQAEDVSAIDEIAELNLASQGYFRRATEFDAYHHRSRKKYAAKVFLFDRCLICTEVRKRRLAYRHHYEWSTLELQLNGSKSVTVLQRGRTAAAKDHAKEEYEFTASEACAMTQWLRCARKILEIDRVESAMRGKFVLPMDLVLSVGAAIWLIWNYL
ncbi:PREDICTED: pleckstrin homology domain-containing family G member 4B isoform X2 [Bactrocera latifrons]|uniref:pleckstrin homology domain-containing family G member 4B isoform X2 n=1 Tax=Bactrocera latifrons TaxID=174628 RepID=UPI0008DD772A|nr:PREDICTED: pleckstrin homology domain-containing family G member 4B isoform X2 [Bactrocera latifrons]